MHHQLDDTRIDATVMHLADASVRLSAPGGDATSALLCEALWQILVLLKQQRAASEDRR